MSLDIYMPIQYVDLEEVMKQKKTVNHKELSLHIWRSIQAQAEATAKSISDQYNDAPAIDAINQIELKRLRTLIRQLEDE